MDLEKFIALMLIHQKNRGLYLKNMSKKVEIVYNIKIKNVIFYTSKKVDEADCNTVMDILCLTSNFLNALYQGKCYPLNLPKG